MALPLEVRVKHRFSAAESPGHTLFPSGRVQRAWAAGEFGRLLRVLEAFLHEELLGGKRPLPSPVIFFLAKCIPSWPPSPEIRTAHAKFTDFHVCVYRISACVDLVSP